MRAALRCPTEPLLPYHIQARRGSMQHMSVSSARAPNTQQQQQRGGGGGPAAAAGAFAAAGGGGGGRRHAPPQKMPSAGQVRGLDLNHTRSQTLVAGAAPACALGAPWWRAL
jgi:hypothetical protein